VQGVPQRETTGALEHRIQRLAVDQLHHQIGGAAFPVELAFAVVVHLGDPGGIEHRGGACLGAEPLDELGVLGELPLEYLDRHAAAQPAVHRLPDLAHAAGGDEALQAIPARQRHTNSRAHGPPCNAASITARPIGAASEPPVADRRSAPSSTSTATATLGVCAGAKAMYHACGGVLRGSVPCSAVPVLDAICTPGIAPFCCATFSAPTISSVSLAATCGVMARRC